MAEQSGPGKFGNWGSGEDYTDYFERAGNGRNGAKRKPNNPKESSSSSSTQSKEPKVPEVAVVSSEHEQHGGLGHKRTTAVDSPQHRHGGVSTTDGPKRTTWQSTGFDRSIEQSPLHPNHQARVVNKGRGVSSPSWERKGSAEGSHSHGVPPTTPGRSRLVSVTRGDDTPDDGPTVPRFGDWDENDPASAEGFTQVFERVRDEKNSGGKAPQTPTASSSHSNGQKRRGNDNSKGCLCFPWGRK